MTQEQNQPAWQEIIIDGYLLHYNPDRYPDTSHMYHYIHHLNAKSKKHVLKACNLLRITPKGNALIEIHPEDGHVYKRYVPFRRITIRPERETAEMKKLTDSLHTPCLLDPRVRRLWGQEHIVEPALCKSIVGDGKQLYAISPLDDRPAYWLVWIDSSITHETLAERLEEIYEAIIEDFGAGDSDSEFPVVDLCDSGCTWWEADLYDISDFKKCPKNVEGEGGEK